MNRALATLDGAGKIAGDRLSDFKSRRVAFETRPLERSPGQIPSLQPTVSDLQVMDTMSTTLRGESDSRSGTSQRRKGSHFKCDPWESVTTRHRPDIRATDVPGDVRVEVRPDVRVDVLGDIPRDSTD